MNVTGDGIFQTSDFMFRTVGNIFDKRSKEDGILLVVVLLSSFLSKQNRLSPALEENINQRFTYFLLPDGCAVFCSF